MEEPHLYNRDVALLYLLRRCTIGAKARLIEWARHDGRSTVVSEHRTVSWSRRDPSDVSRWLVRLLASEGNCGGYPETAYRFGSEALGLTEQDIPIKRCVDA